MPQKGSNSLYQVTMAVLFVAFVLLKVTNNLNWSWIWVTIPIWGTVVIYYICLILIEFLTQLDKKLKKYATKRK